MLRHRWEPSQVNDCSIYFFWLINQLNEMEWLRKFAKIGNLNWNYEKNKMVMRKNLIGLFFLDGFISYAGKQGIIDCIGMWIALQQNNYFVFSLTGHGTFWNDKKNNKKNKSVTWECLHPFPLFIRKSSRIITLFWFLVYFTIDWIKNS